MGTSIMTVYKGTSITTVYKLAQVDVSHGIEQAFASVLTELPQLTLPSTKVVLFGIF